MDAFVSALAQVFSLYSLLLTALGTLFGIIIGALPGLSGVMGLTILMPFTFSLGGLNGIMVMLGIFCGSIYGGSITAILINMPGTANSAPTCIDGYPMANRLGQPGRALGLSTMASTFGGLFSSFMLLFTAPLLAKIALKFNAPEFFALAVFGLSIVTGISTKSVVKGLLSTFLGLLMGVVGMDLASATSRFTFGSLYLSGGIEFIPVLVGVYALAQCLTTAEEVWDKKRATVKMTRVIPSKQDVKRVLPTIMRSSVIGTVIGAIPGTGGDIACWVGYNEAKRWSKHPEEFGEGCPEGIAAPEAANNAVSGGALIPLLTLGIPGDAATAIMLGSLMMQGIIPGPLLFQNQKVQVYTIIFALFIANTFMCLIGFAGLRLFAKVSVIPVKVLTPMVLCCCTIGTYTLNQNFGDVIFMFGSGIIGYFMLKLGFSMPSLILGLILGSMAEDNLRRALTLGDGNIMIFFTRPISCVLMIAAIISLLTPVLMPYVKKWLSNRKSS